MKRFQIGFLPEFDSLYYSISDIMTNILGEKFIDLC